MKSKKRILRDILATGRIGHMEISIASEPRLIVKTPANQFILSAQTGRTRDGDTNIVDTMRRQLTSDMVVQKVTFTAVDKRSLKSQTGDFKVIFRGYDCEEAHGNIYPNIVLSHIRATEFAGTGEPQTAEAIAGLESDATCDRIIYNIPNSKPCTDLEGYDRKFEALHATVWLNSNDGSWYAQRTEAGKATMGVMAEVGLTDVTVEDILDAALQAAPRQPLEY